MTKEALKLALEAQVAAIMEQAQVFASAWSLVGGRFDTGNMLDKAEGAKIELRQMVDEALAEQPERELDKSSVCEDIQQLCMNGDLPWQFEDVIDWITKGEIPAQPQQEPVEVQMRVGSSYWAKVERNTPAEQLAKAQQLMQDYPGVYEMRTLYTSHSRRKTHE